MTEEYKSAYSAKIDIVLVDPVNESDPGEPYKITCTKCKEYLACPVIIGSILLHFDNNSKDLVKTRLCLTCLLADIKCAADKLLELYKLTQIL